MEEVTVTISTTTMAKEISHAGQSRTREPLWTVETGSGRCSGRTEDSDWSDMR